MIYNPIDQAMPYRMTLYVQNEIGYYNLTELISRAYLEGQHQGVPMIPSSWFENQNTGLIALSGAKEGQIGCALRRGRKDDASACLEDWATVFEHRFYLELQRTNRACAQKQFFLVTLSPIEI